ncbi:hypothetical protein WME89_50780 [Sorangium sp. So ce321]|uniref:hypothetical protein n=1 Tax=Sorangium sp. So ce321 TaxID=3133300 RepID=UPI003F5F3A6B
MKKGGRLSGEQGETCLLIAESGAPWPECAVRRRAQARELETVVRLPHEQASTLSLTRRELLGGGVVTVSLEGPRGGPLRPLAHLAAV